MDLTKEKIRLQNEMYKLINEKGTSHPETIRKSQELDQIIVKLQKLRTPKK